MPRHGGDDGFDLCGGQLRTGGRVLDEQDPRCAVVEGEGQSPGDGLESLSIRWVHALREGSSGRFDLPTGTIYPALHRLEGAGLIAGSWSIVDGRRRRTYQLTAAGTRRLHADRGNWREFATTITAMLETRPWPATR